MDSTLSAAPWTTTRRIEALLRLFISALLMALLTSCTSIKLVADYDAEAAKAITDNSAQVFAFYDKLIQAKAKAGTSKLSYAAFADDWGKIETNIRVQVVREGSRPLNSESQQISEITLSLWQKYRARQLASDDYSATLLPLHRDRFQRLFTAALVAEKAKGLAVADKTGEGDDEGKKQ